MKPHDDFEALRPDCEFALEKLKIKAAFIRAAKKSKSAVLALNEYITDLKFGLI